MPDLTELVDKLLGRLEPFYVQYGYLVAFLGALLEHTFFLAWALPGGVIVAIGGLYAASGVLSLPLVVLFAALGFTVGDHLDFFVGRYSKGILQRVTRGRSLPGSYAWSWRAAPALLVAYTNTIPRAAIFMGGAASGLPYYRFLMLSISMALFWSTTMSLLGYWLGSNRERLESALRAIGVGGQVVLLLLLCSSGLYYFMKRRRTPEEKTAGP